VTRVTLLRRLGIVIAIVAAPLMLTTPAALGYGSFSDVDEGHLFYQEITDLSAMGIVSGYPDGTFRPDNLVTRQQFAKMIVLAAFIHTAAVDNQSDPTFSDVSPEMGTPYPFDYIEEAAGAGFILGKDGMFKPGDAITRVQLALIVVRAGGTALAAPPAGYSTGFTDVPDYAQSEVATAKYNGILDGKSPTSFEPYSNATRGQVAKMVSRLLVKKPVSAAGVYYYGFNVTKPPLDNVKVRQALALAIDRQTICDLVGQDAGQESAFLPATGIVPPGMPGFESIKQDYLKPTVQVVQAEALLVDAGYPGGQGLPEIVISYNTSGTHEAVATAVKAQWEAIGVTVSLRSMEWLDYLDYLQSSDDVMVFRMGWLPDYGDAYSFLDIFRGGGPNNYTRWADPAYDKGLDDSLAEMSDEERWAVYAALEKMLSADEMPIAPIYWYGDVEQAGPSGDPIVVGAILSLSGAASFFGEAQRAALLMLEEEINNVGVLGRPIKLVIEDDQTNSTEAVTAVNKLLQQDEVVAVLGPSTSGSTLAVKPIMNAAGIPLLSMGSSNMITEPPMDWVWRVPPSDALGVAAVLGYIQNAMMLTKIAVLHDGWGAAGLADIENLADDFGLEIVATESYATDDSDLTAQLTSIKAANPDVVVVWGLNPGPAVAAKNMKQLGMTQPFVGSHAIANETFIDLAGDAAEGAILPAGWLLVPHLLTDPAQKAVVDQFVAEFTAATGDPPTTFAGHAFGALTLLLDAINRAGSTDAAAIQKALNETAGVITPDGVYNYSPTDHGGLTPDDLAVVMVQNGTWVLAPQ